MTKDILTAMQDKMSKTVAVFKRELGSLRAGRGEIEAFAARHGAKIFP